MNRKKRFLSGCGVFLFWMALWQISATALGKPLLLPSPIQTVNALFLLVQTIDFWQSTGMTILRVTCGYLCAVAGGTLLAVLCVRSKIADAFLRPVRTIIKTTPVSSFIILVLLWLTRDVVPAFISFLMVLPIIWTNVQEGITQTDEDLLEMARAYRFDTMKKIKMIYVPSVQPYFLSACATGLGFAWKSAIAAEVIARPLLAVGDKLQNAKVYLNTEDLFAWTLVVIFISMGLEKLLLLSIKRIGGRRK